MSTFLKQSLTIITIPAMLLSPFYAFAQTQDQFTIGQSIVNNDISAPTVPTDLTATALSSSSIGLTWTASTDNVVVTGYNIFRDMVPIATTSSISYTDTGLDPSTLYAYTVRAFDAAFNYSAHSATATATTLGEGGGQTDSPDVPKIISLRVETESTTARIIFVTDQPTNATVLWGPTTSYSLGSSQQVTFTTEHEVFIDGLSPETRYYFEIQIANEDGDTHQLSNQSFVTDAPPDTEPPMPPTDFHAIGDLNLIDLSWQNPNDPDFDVVRLLRSETFYPLDPADGKLVYEGNGEAAIDRDITPGKLYYYTIFARDESGNYSPGVIASARAFSEEPTPGTPTPGPIDPFEEVPWSPDIPPSIDALTFYDFEFLQRGILLPKVNNRVEISPSDNLTVRVNYDRLPEVLKTIAVTLADSEDPEKIFTFLLRVNEDKGFYEATLAPLLRGGKFPVTITVLDYKNQKLRRLDGALLAPALPTAIGAIDDSSYIWFWRYLSLIILLPLILLLFFLKRRRDEEEEIEKHPPNYTHA